MKNPFCKRIITVFISLMSVIALLAGCAKNPAEVIDNTVDTLSAAYADYLKDHEKLPQSVLDTMDMMLENYVSGTATPPIGSIPVTPVDPSDDDAQDIINSTSSVITSEAELQDLFHREVQQLDNTFTFEVSGDWCTEEVIYDVIFRQVHDEYMIDAFGLNAYAVNYTTTATSNKVYQMWLYYFDEYSADEIRTMRSEMEQKAKEIVRDLDLANMDDYHKAKTIDDYLCDHIYYPEEPFITLDFTPYGALIDGRAVCDGYARATKILSDYCNLECYYISGYCGNDPVNGGHAWNLVRVDGNIYQWDVTWNDGGGAKDYFLVTDDFMSLSRNWNRDHYPASATTAYQVH